MLPVLLLILALQQTGSLDPAAQVDAMRRELAALLTDTGQAKDGDTDRLDDLASRGGRLADDAREPRVKLEARLMQARAYHAIAQAAMDDGRASLASLRIVQMRSAANEVRRLAPPDARPVGDYWLLLADLVDAHRNARTLAERQIGSIAQMERFLSMYAGDAAAQRTPVIIAVKFALMRLCDQAGDNERAMELLGQLRDPDMPDAEREPVFAAVAANAQLVGQPLDPALRPVSDGEATWMLLVLEPPREGDAPADTEALPEIDSVVRVERRSVGADAVIGLPQGLGAVLPRYALIDDHQMIRAVGHTPAVAARYTELTRDAAPPSSSTESENVTPPAPAAPTR